MFKMSGGHVELDPRSSDFGKVKIGQTRLDFWSGYVQYARFAAQFAKGQRKSEGGMIQEMTRRDVIDRFAQSKFSPAAGLLNDILQGQTYMGEEMTMEGGTFKTQAYQRLTPLAIQDMIDGFSQDGALGLGVTSVGILGVGVTTYRDDVLKAREKAAQDKYGMSWDEVGQKLGRAKQLELERDTPALIEAERKQEEKYAIGKPTVMKQWSNEGKAIEKTYQDAINLAAKEYEKTKDGVTFRDKVDTATKTRRTMYASRNARKEYQDIVLYYNRNLSESDKAKMNPGDVARMAYNQTMYAPDMYDEFGNYKFDEADKRETQFIKDYGQEALDYIQAYNASKWNQPEALKQLRQAQDTLDSYWGIRDALINQAGLTEVDKKYQVLLNTNPDTAKLYARYTGLDQVLKTVAAYRKQYKEHNLAVKYYLQKFYTQ
jgi:hypothetical protein